MIYIVKKNHNRFHLVAERLISSSSFSLLSTMNEREYHIFIERLEQMNTSKKLPFTFYFPNSPSEVVVTLIKRIDHSINLILNLGGVVLSRITETQFQQLLYQLKDMVSAYDGKEVYFP